MVISKAFYLLGVVSALGSAYITWQETKNRMAVAGWLISALLFLSISL